MSKTVKEHCFASISVISQPFWLFLGSFRRVNPCGLRVRVYAGTGAGQAELPVGYPRQSLIQTETKGKRRAARAGGNPANQADSEHDSIWKAAGPDWCW